MRVNPKYIQLISDALIPLLGYFWWDWSLYFIVLFYLLDYCANEVFTHIKSKKIVHHQKLQNNSWLLYGLLSGALLFSGVLLIHAAFLAIDPNIKFPKEILAFLSYKDIGIEQGYILLPLIILVGFQRYKLEFILPKKYEKLLLTEFWTEHLKAHYLLIAGVAFVIGLSSFIVLPDVFFIFGIVTITSFYQYFKN